MSGSFDNLLRLQSLDEGEYGNISAGLRPPHSIFIIPPRFSKGTIASMGFSHGLGHFRTSREQKGCPLYSRERTSSGRMQRSEMNGADVIDMICRQGWHL